MNYDEGHMTPNARIVLTRDFYGNGFHCTAPRELGSTPQNATARKLVASEDQHKIVAFYILMDRIKPDTPQNIVGFKVRSTLL